MRDDVDAGHIAALRPIGTRGADLHDLAVARRVAAHHDDVFGLLDDQTHRRVIKTHTPLDGVPRVPSVTYIAMSVTHWMSRCRIETMTGTSTSTAWRRSEAAVGQGGTEDALFEDEPEEPDAYLRWYIDSDLGGSGVALPHLAADGQVQ